MNPLLELLKSADQSPHVLIAYNGKIAVMDYITPSTVKPKKADLKKQFSFGAMRICDNSSEPGYVRTPDGKYYEVSRYSKTAKLITV